MNCENAKKIKLTSILAKIGASEIRTLNNEVWYLSPFRKETTASLKVDIQKNIFYDFGEGFGGNVLDFMMRYYNCDISNALKILSQDFASFSFNQPTTKANISEEDSSNIKTYEIQNVQSLSNPLLIEYLKSRKLDLEICNKYLCEVNYQINGKKYFGVGFKNDENGFEIRNKYAKLCLGKKWFTHIKNNSKSVVVLESWSDFISMLTIDPKTDKANDFLILNSLTMLNKLDAVIEKYPHIILAFDQDQAGLKATEKCMEKWKDRCSDSRSLYPNAKDINEFLMNKPSIKRGMKF